MKTLSKKLLTGCMALAMACAMAIPTFAAEPAVSPRAAYPDTTYAIQSNQDGQFLSAASGTAVLSRSVSYWTPRRYGSVTKLFYGNSSGSSGMVATYNKGPVILTSASTEDSRTSVDFHSLGGSVHRIYMDQKAVYICSYQGAVQTKWYEESANWQKWTLYD